MAADGSIPYREDTRMTNNSTMDTTDAGADLTGPDAEENGQVIAAEIVDEAEDQAEDRAEVEAEDETTEDSEPEATPVIREVIERQLEAGRNLSDELIVAVTDATAAVVESPVRVVTAVREGATLPTAIDQAGETLQNEMSATGSRIRSAVGEYVGHQATLPNAVITGVAGVAGSVIRGQGAVTGSGVHGIMTVATEAARAGDVRSTFTQEWRDTAEVAKSARADVADAWAAARQGIREAVPEPALAG